MAAVCKRRLLLLMVGAAVCVAGSYAGGDWHVAADARSRALFARSAFLHGYMHGYEQGFHAADLDLHMGRSRDPEKLDDFRHVAGYEGQFGDKGSFSTGYYQGFRVGYGDGISLRPFRALAEVRAAGQGLPDAREAKPEKTFDEGIVAGYKSGILQGRQDASSGGARRKVPAPCQASRSSNEYCDAYRRGYGLGYGDGYVGQAPAALAEQK